MSTLQRGLTLRRKTIQVIGLTLLALIAVLYIASSQILLDGFAQVEEGYARESVARVMDAVADDITKLDTITSDWAGWDDTYAFVQDGNAAYIKSTLNNETLADIKLSLVAYLRPSGQICYGTGFDLKTGKKIPLPASFRSYLAPGSILLQHPTLTSSHNGLVLLPEGVLVVASRPILKSDKTGPVRGTLIQGRYLDEAELQRLAELTHFPLTLEPFNGKSLPADFQAARRDLSANYNLNAEGTPDTKPITLLPLDHAHLCGYAVLRDVNDKPALLLRVDLPRAIYQQGWRSLGYLMFSLLTAGLVFGLVALLLLERQVLTRLTYLSEEVGQVRASGSLAQRVHVPGQDELAALGSDINGMLAALEQAQRRQEESEQRLSRIVETNADGILIVDNAGRITFANAAAERIFGMRRGDLTQRYYDEETWSITATGGQQLPAGELPHLRVAETGAPVYGVEHTILHPSARRVMLSVNAAPLRDTAGEMAGTVLSITDITSRKALEERLLQLAYRDPLTNLANRTLFLDRLEHAWARAKRNQSGVAVLFIDLDNFKFVNDSLGHAAGDELLVAVAGRLRSCLRAGDTASRFGGDEFTLLLDNVTLPEQAIPAAERVLKALVEPFSIGGHEVFTPPSIGVAVADRGEGSLMLEPSDLLRFADAAMYQAKTNGKARYEIYEASMGDSALQRLELESALRRSIEHNELVLYYQPQMVLETGLILGFEALVRWAHPAWGLVPPLDFIPLAEETGLILPIGEWVLREACRQGLAWKKEYPATTPLSMCVNLSVRQLREPTLVQQIERVLQETGFDPQHLVLEVTESMMMTNVEANIKTLYAIKELGVGLAIDDFGTGFSSLAYLQSFPMDYLKIDRKFVLGLSQKDSGGLAIVEKTINLAQTLGLKTIVEGVETAEVAALLRQMGSDLAQGYYFSKPLPAPELEPFIQLHLA